MQSHGGFGEPPIAAVPPWCVDPEHCDRVSAVGKKCGKCRGIPHLHSTASNLVEGSRSVWVYYPQGIQRRPVGEFDLFSGRGLEEPHTIAHVCGGSNSKPEFRNENAAASLSAPYPGNSLFQDSFHLCKFKKFGDIPGLDDVYVEIVVDEFSGLAFAKVYSSRSALTATDILSTCVAPFFSHHGVPIEQVLTRQTNEYCGLAPIHPYETFLAASHIKHELAGPVDSAHRPLCDIFFAVLQYEFLRKALRGRYQHSLDSLQRSLDEFLAAYNSSQPSPSHAMLGLPAMRAFHTTAQA